MSWAEEPAAAAMPCDVGGGGMLVSGEAFGVAFGEEVMRCDAPWCCCQGSRSSEKRDIGQGNRVRDKEERGNEREGEQEYCRQA